MPTYVCYSATGQLSPEQRRLMATRIAQVHSRCTGAPIAFAQCIFHELDPQTHFIGGAEAPGKNVWVLGHIRNGRDRAVRDRLLAEILDAATDILELPATAVWIYLTELDHHDMVEFGRALPAPGQEAQWLAADGG